MPVWTKPARSEESVMELANPILERIAVLEVLDAFRTRGLDDHELPSPYLVLARLAPDELP